MNRITDKQWTELQLKICELQQQMEFMRQQFQYQLAEIGNQIDWINEIFDDNNTAGKTKI